MTISAVNGAKAMAGKEFTEFLIRPHFNSKFSCKVEASAVPRVCNYIPLQSQVVTNLLQLSNLNLTDPLFFDNTKIKVSLGAEIHAKMIR